jgi:hypothetical protein
MSACRCSAGVLAALAVVFLLIGAVFLFYSVNFRTLIIHLDSDALKLTFAERDPCGIYPFPRADPMMSCG